MPGKPSREITAESRMQCTGMICRINPPLYLQSSNPSPSVQFPNLSITPGKCRILESKAQLLLDEEQDVQFSCPGGNPTETEAPTRCRNSCFGCIPCGAALPGTDPRHSRLKHSHRSWRCGQNAWKDLWPDRKYLQSFSQQPVNRLASHSKHRRASKGSYWGIILNPLGSRQCGDCHNDAESSRPLLACVERLRSLCASRGSHTSPPLPSSLCHFSTVSPQEKQ